MGRIYPLRVLEFDLRHLEAGNSASDRHEMPCGPAGFLAELQHVALFFVACVVCLVVEGAPIRKILFKHFRIHSAALCGGLLLSLFRLGFYGPKIAHLLRILNFHPCIRSLRQRRELGCHARRR